MLHKTLYNFLWASVYFFCPPAPSTQPKGNIEILGCEGDNNTAGVWFHRPSTVVWNANLMAIKLDTLQTPFIHIYLFIYIYTYFNRSVGHLKREIILLLCARIQPANLPFQPIVVLIGGVITIWNELMKWYHYQCIVNIYIYILSLSLYIIILIIYNHHIYIIIINIILNTVTVIFRNPGTLRNFISGQVEVGGQLSHLRNQNNIAVWWYTYPSEKHESQWGLWNSHKYMEK